MFLVQLRVAFWSKEARKNVLIGGPSRPNCGTAPASAIERCFGMAGNLLVPWPIETKQFRKTNLLIDLIVST